jgi:hypothetical protein
LQERDLLVAGTLTIEEDFDVFSNTIAPALADCALVFLLFYRQIVNPYYMHY